MKIPNAEQAIINQEKIVRYLLNVGRSMLERKRPVSLLCFLIKEELWNFHFLKM